MTEPWELGVLLRQAGELAEDAASKCDPEAHELRRGHCFERLKERVGAAGWPRVQEYLISNSLARDLGEIDQRIAAYIAYRAAPWATTRTAFPAEPVAADSAETRGLITDDWPAGPSDFPPGLNTGVPEIDQAFSEWEPWASRTYTWRR